MKQTKKDLKSGDISKVYAKIRTTVNVGEKIFNNNRGWRRQLNQQLRERQRITSQVERLSLQNTEHMKEQALLVQAATAEAQRLRQAHVLSRGQAKKAA